MADKIIKMVIVNQIPYGENLKKLLEFEVDFKVIGIVDTGAEALELVPKIKPDVVLIDMNLPDMNGIQVTEKLKKLLPTINIIQTAPHADRDQLRHAMLAGASDLLAGPFMPEQLYAMIRGI
jgi:pilus assembly protein CpaE